MWLAFQFAQAIDELFDHLSAHQSGFPFTAADTPAHIGCCVHQNAMVILKTFQDFQLFLNALVRHYACAPLPLLFMLATFSVVAA